MNKEKNESKGNGNVKGIAKHAATRKRSKKKISYDMMTDDDMQHKEQQQELLG